MKYFNCLFLTLILMSNLVYSQIINFTELPCIETFVKMDTLVIPDKIYLKIVLDEKDSKGKFSIEQLEKNMTNKLTELGVDLHKQLSVIDISSNFTKYFLKPQNILKKKSYILLLYNEKIVMETVISLKKKDISNIFVEKTEYSKIEDVRLSLKTKAIEKARANARALVAPLNQKIGSAIFISDKSVYSQPNIYGKISNDFNSLINSDENLINIEFKKIKVETEVTVKFQLK